MDFSSYNKLFALIESELSKREQTVIAIDGGAASGKTTLSSFLAEKYSAGVVHMDDFFLPPEKRNLERLSEFDGNTDRERFIEEVLPHLGKYEKFSYGKYDCHLGKISKKAEIFPSKLIIVEGVYSLSPYFIQKYNIKIMLSVSEKEQLERLKRRSSAEIYDMFIKKWLPLEKRYFEVGEIAKKCDLCL